MASVCRVCLSGDLRLRSVQNDLINLYDKLTNGEFNSKDGRPRAVCSYCYQQLLKCYTFSKTAQRSEQIFNQLFSEGVLKIVPELNISNKLQWSTTPLYLTSVDEKNISQKYSPVAVKEEPVLVKHESFMEEECAGFESVYSDTLTEQEIKSALIFDDPSSTEEPHEAQELRDNQQSESNITFECDSCSKSYGTKAKLIRHIKNNHKIVNVMDQKRLHTGKKPTYSECGKSIRQSSNLKVHKRLHTGEKQFDCSVCDKTFTRKTILTVHMRLHTGEKPFNCSECDKTFNKKTNLTGHMRLHTGEKPFNCSECDKSFRHKHSLKVHKRLHTGEKPFNCSVCDKSFRHQMTLKVHKRLHTGEKQFDCSVCDKSFRHKHSLKVHKRIHTGEKPFNCSVCNKIFTFKTNLTVHMRIHTREKP